MFGAAAAAEDLLNYVRTLTEEESIELRKENVKKLRPKVIFDLGMNKYYIAEDVMMNDDCTEFDHVLAIELNEQNVDKILVGEPCTRVRLRFDDLICLNVREPAIEIPVT